MRRIVVVDLGTGNLHSVSKALEHVAGGVTVKVSAEPAVIAAADHVVLPGQGAIGTWFKALGKDTLHQAITIALASRPVLGICLGLQALFDHSDEDGGTTGLGVLAGQVRRFGSGENTRGQELKVPHMGWNNVTQHGEHPLWLGIPQDTRFYFVHSYYADARAPDQVAGTTDYGVRFTSAAAADNVFAVQFHPEKSHAQGLKLLENFVNWDGGT
ncbi:MAG: imidazole glycerol phosphate synthase subunit HisH [Arenicellales bacterium]|jgi:glutamine amidotransferase|nr:imidazole glycerol phosphate synthase subunit HisH [Arenicellales bacterium]MDP7563146.1 imidazole glycerol phosphate synthase subunit HisH [Arenicellales bacterium]